MRRQDPYANIALPVQDVDPYAGIADPVPTNRNRRPAPAAPGVPVPQDGADAPFQPELLPGDNGIYPPPPLAGATATPPPIDTIGEEEAAANRNVFGNQGTRLDPIDLNTLPAEDRAYLNAGMYVKLGNGEVRRMMADARPNAGGPGTQEIRPGLFVEENADVPTDMAKSLPTGVVEGVTGMVGLPGSLYNMIPENLRSPTSMLRNLPTGEGMNQGIRDQIGYDYYQPQTMAGEYSRTLGEFLPGAIAPGSALARGASVVVPALASESAGQLARALEGGERDTAAEGFARMGGAVFGGLGVGATNAFRGGADIALRSSMDGLTPQQVQEAMAMSAALRQRAGSMGINNLSNANSMQQVTGGGTGLGRLQRVVEGQTPRMNQYFSDLNNQVRGAIDTQLDAVGSVVPPSQLAHQSREAANTVLERTRQRINAEARPFYGAADQQVISAEEYDALRSMPAFREAEAAFYAEPVLSQGVGGPQSVSALNRIFQEMDTLARNADPGNMLPGANAARSSALSESAQLGKMLVDEASPAYAQARAIGAAGRQGVLAPTQRSPIGSIAAQPELQPTLPGTLGALFPDQWYGGQADETALALELMGEVDPSVGGALVRQQLQRQAMDAQRQLIAGDNDFGGAKFAASAFGNDEQRRTVMGALDVVNRPDPNMAFPPLNQNGTAARGSDPMAALVEVLQATGQRQRQGSDTAFNQEAIAALRGGNLATSAVKSGTNLLSIPGQIGRGIDDFVARQNAQTLADLLMGSSEEFSARLTRAINRPRGANRIRAGVAIGAGQED